MGKRLATEFSLEVRVRPCAALQHFVQTPMLFVCLRSPRHPPLAVKAGVGSLLPQGCRPTSSLAAFLCAERGMHLLNAVPAVNTLNHRSLFMGNSYSVRCFMF